MSDTHTIQPDPSAIGGVPKAPFALLPDASRLFARRAERFDGLAPGSDLAAYLHFLAEISRAQSDIANDLPPAEPILAEVTERSRTGQMPPIDRSSVSGGQVRATLRALFEKADAIEKPEQAATALAALRQADDATLDTLIRDALSDAIPVETLAANLFVSAGLQVHMARWAGGADATRLVPVSVGVCPVCGGKPIASMVVGVMGAEGARYCVCSCCATQWNEVRVKCVTCGSTKGVGYRSVAEDDRDATVKAEVCDECGSYVKILYANKNPSLDPVADDVASLGLDLLMRDTEYRRAALNPYLLGY
ncbi:Tat proofreading chaperone FdhE [Faunimonas pinastri]|uniref:Protein FdhE homolog n=1 Tax=Faunimonas pinastri TaxID=1855383 RepID=A0A1H9NIN2_9HYPH|nr:formate dehydrogenase accessory protein FdhE [Faunimonas pinastri]SER35778.1 Tat proofreading chaperone FdhE [Faunimonas pinastri]